MIKASELKLIFLSANQDWEIRLSKWEHCTEEELKKRKYPLPNITSVRIINTSSKLDDVIGNRIISYYLEDCDEDFCKKRDDMISFFCDGLDDNDILNFYLYTEDTPGHYNYLPLTISQGDKGYSDKRMLVELEEETI